jgi:hypothetical protein
MALGKGNSVLRPLAVIAILILVAYWAGARWGPRGPVYVEAVPPMGSENAGVLKAQDEYVIEATAHVLSGLENNIIQKVVNPHGMLVGGHYPDAVASTAIAHVHRFPSLLDSATFKAMYDKLLPAVKAWDAKFNHAYSSHELMADIRAELDGNYILKPKYTPSAPAPRRT